MPWKVIVVAIVCALVLAALAAVWIAMQGLEIHRFMREADPGRIVTP